jgi:arylformamidase
MEDRATTISYRKTLRLPINMYDFKNAVDLTHVLENGMPVYPGDPAPVFESYATLSKNGVNLTRLIMGSHTGTHIDAPRHFIDNGIGIDKILPDKLIGEGYVADLSRKPIGSGISSEDLQAYDRHIRPDDIVICYTGCSDHWDEDQVRTNYTFLTEDGADHIVSKKARAVGIDYLSVEKFKAKDPIAHKTLLRNGVFIIESLSNAVKLLVGQRVLMICLPIKLKNGDGAPSRVLAVPILSKN